MDILMVILLLFLVVCAVIVSFCKDGLISVIIFSAYSLVMAIIWIIMESPDLAITEAAVGAGVTGLLFYATFKKLRQIDTDKFTEKEAKKDE